MLQTAESTTGRQLSAERVAVCICTAGRNQLLLGLLGALTHQSYLRDGRVFTVVVVDNNPRGDARQTVEDWALASGLPVRYLHVPTPGLSGARNASLATATSCADLAALIDDDEVPEPQWLEELLACRSRTGAPIIIGPVIFPLPESAPGWLTKEAFFELATFPNDACLREGITGNALLELAPLEFCKISFDPAFAHSGGEDQVFFRTAHAAGLGIRYAAHAIVTEDVPTSRLSLRWLVKRQYRKGNTLGLLARYRPELGENRAWRLAAAGKRTLQGLGLLLESPGKNGRTTAARGLIELSFAAGMLTGLLGRRFDAYSR